MKPVQTLIKRVSRFGAVGAGGVVIQLVTLGLLLKLFKSNYLLATALAVEASVLFNFVWHRRWTWADRPRGPASLVLLRFNLSSGIASIVLNLCIMYLLVGGLGLRPVLANLITISICSIVNFTLADRFVFV
jgi:putative flippase GtrA